MKTIWTGVLVTLGTVIGLAAACNRTNQDEPTEFERQNIDRGMQYNAPSPGMPPAAEPAPVEESEMERMGGSGGYGGAQGWPEE